MVLISSAQLETTPGSYRAKLPLDRDAPSSFLAQARLGMGIASASTMRPGPIVTSAISERKFPLYHPALAGLAPYKIPLRAGTHRKRGRAPCRNVPIVK